MLKKFNSEIKKSALKVKQEMTDYVSLSFRELKKYKKSKFQKFETENRKLDNRVKALENLINKMLNTSNKDEIIKWTKSKLFDIEMKIRNLESRNSSEVLDIKSRQLESKVEEVKKACVDKLAELQNNFMKMVQNYRKNLEGFDEFFAEKSHIFDALDHIKSDISQFRAERQEKRKTIFSLEPDSSLLLNTKFDRKKEYLDKLSDQKKKAGFENFQEKNSEKSFAGNKLMIEMKDYYGVRQVRHEESSSKYHICRLEDKLTKIKTKKFSNKKIAFNSEENSENKRNKSSPSIKNKSERKALNLNLAGLKILEKSSNQALEPRSNHDLDYLSSDKSSLEKFQNPIFEIQNLKEHTKGTFDYSISNNSIPSNLKKP